MKYTINELANSKGVSQPVREALLQMEAELDATNRQVEILSDALAESRREVATLKANITLDKKAENARELGLDYD
jgi:predicted  nucleic acid-binding Zn-ribbon protein